MSQILSKDTIAIYSKKWSEEASVLEDASPWKLLSPDHKTQKSKTKTLILQLLL